MSEPAIRDHEYWMRHALGLAQKAQEQGEVPVGAVLVRNDELVAEGWNQPISSHDASAHAEIMAIRNAGRVLQNYRLAGDTTLYVTLEPCPMCAGAIVHARINRVVFGAFDLRTGSGGTVFNLLQNESLNHKAEVISGVMEEACAMLLQGFFRAKR